jgi:uncharacterized OsmC-like protein
MSETIRTAIDAASTWLREHADEAAYTDTVARARLESGLRVSVSGPDGALITTDMPVAVGGADSAISPGWAYRAALAACVLSLATMRAAQQRIGGFTCEVDVDSASDDRGILGLDPSVVAGPSSVRIAFRMAAATAGRVELEAIAAWAVDHCPVADATRRAVPVTVEVEISEA